MIREDETNKAIKLDSNMYEYVIFRRILTKCVVYYIGKSMDLHCTFSNVAIKISNQFFGICNWSIKICV